jgi:hypothetical protein
MIVILCPRVDCDGHLIKSGRVYYTAPLQYDCKCTCCGGSFRIPEDELINFTKDDD